MGFKITVQSSFSAAHRLRDYKGRCEKLHGHNWKVEVSAAADKLNKQGMVSDFNDLKKALNNILIKLDHKFLNDIAYFKKFNPTSENIAKYIFERLDRRLSSVGCQPSAVSVWETDTSRATYSKG